MKPTLRRAENGRLLLETGHGPVPVEIRRCFPWAAPDRWISLRDDNGGEVGLVENPADLDPASQALLREELRDSGHTFEITAVHACRKELELRCWEVETRQGPRRFQTELDEWPRPLPGGGVLIRDICGDLYTISDPAALAPAGRARVEALMQ